MSLLQRRAALYQKSRVTMPHPAAATAEPAAGHAGRNDRYTDLMRSVRPLVSLILIGACAVSARVASSDARDIPGRPGAPRDLALPADFTVMSANVPKGATLATLLRAEDIAAPEVAEVVRQASTVFDPRKVRTAQPFRLERTARGAVKCFEYEIDGDRFLRVSRSPDDALEAVVLPIPKTRSVEHVRGQIDRGSLVAALDAAGETIDLTLAMADILGGEIDFSTEVQPGDRFDVTVEKQYRDNHVFAGYGPVLAVEFTNAGRRVRAVRFAPEGGAPAYFDERGVSMRRFFLASPLKFQPVVTSSFSLSRFHPILKEYRAHLGVDYRAPAGAPVVAVADGVVVTAGMSGASGRMVHLRHANGYESEYLHLSAITVQPGTHVRQGELVGRVGSTGLATAAHLDYRLKKNGTFINPVTAHRSMPPADPVPAGQIAAFAVVRDRAFAVPTPDRPPATAAVDH
jgi:murein DD-endopeptidase MepM/ murein hydrolase activator NlpD